jgi:hypothetical protein
VVVSGLKIPTNTWMNSVDFLASMAHALAGCLIVLGAAVFLGFAPAWWVAWLVLAAVTAVKEYWYDANYEIPKQTFRDNTLDFAFYQVGAAIGTGAAWLAHHLHRIT